MHQAAILPGEHVTAVVVAVAETLLLGSLRHLPDPQRPNRLPVKCSQPPGSLTLAVTGLGTPRHDHPGLLHRQIARIEIQRIPAQPAQLRSTHTRSGREQEQPIEPIRSHMQQELTHLIRGPHGRPAPAHPGRLHLTDRVVHHISPPLGIRESPMQHDVYVPHRLRRQSWFEFGRDTALAVAAQCRTSSVVADPAFSDKISRFRVDAVGLLVGPVPVHHDVVVGLDSPLLQQQRVEEVQLVRRNLLQPNITQVRHHVGVGVILPVVVSGGVDRELDRRQPLILDLGIELCPYG